MPRESLVFLVLVLALGFAVSAVAGDPHSASDRTHGLSPGSPFCVNGPIFEQVRGSLDEGAELEQATREGYDDGTIVTGKLVTAVQYVYRDQPPEFLIYDTTDSLEPIVYMATQFTPKSSNGFIRVDFNAQVSVVPSPGGFAGLGYAIYVKEDGGDGHISHPGEVDCGGDDICGYLEQTAVGLWLVGSTNELQFNSAATSNFFKTGCRRKLEIQAHIFPIHGYQDEPGQVYVNAGFIGLTSGK